MNTPKPNKKARMTVRALDTKLNKAGNIQFKALVHFTTVKGAKANNTKNKGGHLNG